MHFVLLGPCTNTNASSFFGRRVRRSSGSDGVVKKYLSLIAYRQAGRAQVVASGLIKPVIG